MATDLLAFQTAVQTSKVLREGTRAKLLAAAPRLKPAQWEAILNLMQAAEQRARTHRQEIHEKKVAVEQECLVKASDFVKKELPKRVRALEVADREREAVKLEKILSELS